MYQIGFKSQLCHLNPSMLLNFLQCQVFFFPWKIGHSNSTCLAEYRRQSNEVMHAKSWAQGREHNKCHHNDSYVVMVAKRLLFYGGLVLICHLVQQGESSCPNFTEKTRNVEICPQSLKRYLLSLVTATLVNPQRYVPIFPWHLHHIYAWIQFFLQEKKNNQESN